MLGVEFMECSRESLQFCHTGYGVIGITNHFPFNLSTGGVRDQSKASSPYFEVN